MKLSELRDRPGARKAGRRIGRGIGSGKGKTGGRGGKGQTARSGVRIKGFEGGQMPLHRRLPKRGFRNTPFAKRYNEVNLGRVQAAIDAGKLDAGATVDVAALVKAGVLRREKDGVSGATGLTMATFESFLRTLSEAPVLRERNDLRDPVGCTGAGTCDGGKLPRIL